MENGRRKTIVVGDRFPFRYLADGIEYMERGISGLRIGGRTAPQQLPFWPVSLSVKTFLVFCLELSNGKIADTL